MALHQTIHDSANANANRPSLLSSSLPRPSTSTALSHHDGRPAPLPLPLRGALASLLTSRSAASLPVHGYVPSHAHHSQPPLSARSASFGLGPDGDDYHNSASAHDLDDEDGVPPRRPAADERRLNELINGPQMRSMRLIGKSNPRYEWERYWKSDEALKNMPKPIREYYERTNSLVQQYLFIDRLLDSSRPHDILNEYEPAAANSAAHSAAGSAAAPAFPSAIQEEGSPATLASGHTSPPSLGEAAAALQSNSATLASKKLRRTPREMLSRNDGGANDGIVPESTTPLLQQERRLAYGTTGSSGSGGGDASVSGGGGGGGGIEAGTALKHEVDWLEDSEMDSGSRLVTIAIWVNFAANAILLASKVLVIVWVPSMSVLAGLVDAALDFLSTVIVWLTTKLISKSQHDQYQYPVGRRRLEPLGVLVFSVIMITSFVQVAIQCVEKLASSDGELIQLGMPAIMIMASTVVIKGAVWLWYRLVKNSSVRALADDAHTDVIFNIGSILFPIVGFYARLWWLDALGGLILSLVVVYNWTSSSLVHVRNLSGFSALPDERNLLLYLTMRFATAIRQIQNLRAYHAGDQLFVEVDIVLDAATPLRDSHDLGEVLTYFLESVPFVDRAFVHIDYASYHAPTHLLQGSAEE